jgi:DNA-binding MarR family transcriptional regulator
MCWRVLGGTSRRRPDYLVLNSVYCLPSLALAKGEMRQQVLAGMLAWDKSRLSHQLTRMQERSLIERRRVDGKTVLIALTQLGREKLDAARPVHAAAIRRDLLLRLTQEQIDTIVRVSNLLGEEE